MLNLPGVQPVKNAQYPQLYMHGWRIDAARNLLVIAASDYPFLIQSRMTPKDASLLVAIN